MKKINFQQFKIYTSVTRKTSETVDIRELFADMIYKNVSGIRAHALAMKIYKNEGTTDYDDAEVKLIKNVAEQLCVPGFIDGLNEQLGESDKDNIDNTKKQ